MFTRTVALSVGRSRPWPRRKRQRGFTLVELLIAAGLSGIVLIAMMSLILFSARSFAALVNYVDLDNFSRGALDEMTWEIRQADRLVEGSTNRMTFQFSNPTNSASSWQVSYVYSPQTRELTRIQGGNRKVLLQECDFLQFDFYRRNPVANSFNLFVTAPQPLVDPSICKAVQMRWICSRRIMQEMLNTESVQSARVVIRKK